MDPRPSPHRRERLRALLLAAAKERANAALTLRSTAEEREPTALFAPFSPSPDAVIEAVWGRLETLGFRLAPDELLVDLGCGDGRWLISGVERYGCRALGIEIDPELVQRAADVTRRRQLDGQIQIREADIIQVPIRDARLVIVYAFAESLHGIRQHLERQLSPRACVLSIGFRIPDWRPEHADRHDGLRWYFYDLSGIQGA